MKPVWRTAFYAIAFLFSVFRPCVIAQDLGRMDQVVKSYADEAKTFMGSVLVARDGQVVLSRGYGYANLEWNITNTSSTKFRLGSLTKQFTSAAILLLEERGKLRIDDAVKRHMPDAPAAWDEVTIFHLLTHTSGIPNFTGFPDYNSSEGKAAPSPVEKTVARFSDKPLEFRPGEKWSYSNSGYVLLGYLIEKISGQSYEKFIQDNIFAPLDMKDSGYDSNSRVILRRASGYSPAAAGPVNAEFIHMTIPHAAGGLYSTTEDLLRWTQGLFGGKLLSASSLAKMTTPFKSDYALGLAVHTMNARKVIQHDGGIDGFNTRLSYYPDSKLTVAVLANLNGPGTGDIANKLAALAFGEAVQLSSERKAITLPPEVLARYIGIYELTPATSMTITVSDGQLMGQLSGQPTFPFFAESETTFFLKVVDAQVEFVKDEKGNVSSAVLHQGGRDIKASRRD